MTTQAKTRPVETLRDGVIKAAIWKNESENGAFYNVTFARTFKDDKGELHDTESFSGTQLLRLARLADKAYERAGKLARAARITEDGEQGTEEA